MKHIILVFHLLTILNLSLAQNYEWGFSTGSINYDNAFAVDTDLDGNHLIFGRFGGTMDFDPGPAVNSLTAAGSDIFLAKYNATGDLIWVKQIDCTGSQTPFTIKIDGNNHIVLGGSYGGTIDFDPGPAIQSSTSAGLDDMFVLKLNENGNYIWHYAVGAANNQRVNELTIDSNNDIVFTGFITTATVDFDPGPGTINLTPNNSDIVVVKLNSSGTIQFAKIFTGTGLSFGYGITTDNLNNIYTTGNLGGNVDFDPGVGTFNLANIGSINCFISKLDANGNFVWAKGIHNIGTVAGRGIKIDTDQNLIVSGLFNTTTDFDLGTGTFNMTPVGTSTNAFLLKLDASGNFIWSKFIEASGGSSNNLNIDINNDNDIVMVGAYSVNIDLGESGSTTSYPAIGGNDCYLAVYDENGNFKLGHAFGGNADDLLYGVSMTGTEIIVCGFYQISIADLDPGSNTINFNSNGGDDLIVAKYNTCTDNGSSINITSCDSYLWPTNGTTYTTSGTYTETLTNISGCDSVVTLNLTINNSNASSQTISACDSYLWPTNGTTYTASGTYTETLTNISGCDSVVTLNLTINNSNASSQTISACDSYLWSTNGTTYTTSGTYTETLTNISGCDSVVTLNLTITNSNTGTAIVAACDTYTWIDGNTYTSSNSTATHTLINVAGCDSVVTLNLTINSSYNQSENISICNNENYTLPNGTVVNSNGTYYSNLTSINGCDSIIETNITVISPNINTAVTNQTISALAFSPTYQWLRCPDYSLLAGENNQSIFITENGSYAVVIEENGCIDTSDCVVIDFIGLEKQNDFEIAIFPNPASNKIHINSGNHKITLIEFYNAKGDKVFISEDVEFIDFNLPPGLYQVVLRTASNTVITKSLVII